MKSRMMWFVCVLLLVSFAACERDTGLEPDPAASDGDTTAAADAAAFDLATLAGWELADDVTDKDGLCVVLNFEREIIVGNIAHYSAQVQVGPGEYDRIGIHRVVKERRPYQPMKTHRNVFLQHGDLKDFAGIFLPGQYSPNLPDDFGVAVFLAQHDVDVWGIDQNWNLVPGDETDFSFMANWGLQNQVDNLHFALAVRAVGATPDRRTAMAGCSCSATAAVP